MPRSTRKNSKKEQPVMQTEFNASMRAIKQEFDQVREAKKASATTIIEYIDASEGRMMRHYDVVAENIHQDVAGANRDEISAISNRQKHHERRIKVIEKQLHITG